MLRDGLHKNYEPPYALTPSNFSISFPFTFGKKGLYFPSVANAASPIQTNFGERKEFLTNTIFVQQNKVHRVVQ